MRTSRYRGDELVSIFFAAGFWTRTTFRARRSSYCPRPHAAILAIATLDTAVAGWMGRMLGAPIEVKARAVIGCHHCFTDRRDPMTPRIIEIMIFVAREQACEPEPRYDRLWRGVVAWRKQLAER